MARSPQTAKAAAIGRRLHSGTKHQIPRYSCSRGWMDNAEPRCIAFGGLWVDDAVEHALLTIVSPGAISAAAAAEREAGESRDQVRDALHRDLEAARYAVDRAFRQYDAIDPTNRLVASELEARWNKSLAHVAEIESKIATHDATMPAARIDPISLASLATDLKTVWSAPTTDARLKKRIVRTVIEEVVADIDAEAAEIILIVHWMGGIHSEMRLPRRRRGQRNDTSADVIAAVRYLVLIANDDLIAGIPNRNGLVTGHGNRQAAQLLRVAPKTLKLAAQICEIEALHPRRKVHGSSRAWCSPAQPHNPSANGHV